jgi:type IV pilus assembly protein PilP
MHRNPFSIFVSLIVAIAMGLCLPSGCDQAPPEQSKPKMVQKRIIVPPQKILNEQPVTTDSQLELPRTTKANTETTDAQPAAVANLQPTENPTDATPETNMTETALPAATADASAQPAEQPAAPTPDDVKAAAQTADAQKGETAEVQPPEKPADSAPDTTESEAQTPTAQVTEPVAVPGVQPDETSSQTAGPASDPSVRKPDVQSAPAKTAPDKSPADQPTAGSLLAKALAPQQFYHAQDKIDPFAPLIKNEAPEPQAPKKKKIRRAPLTPLEKMALNQLTLVAVIHSADDDRSIAMVEEASGKGYIVKKGTFIGVNSGRVIDIDTDRIIIREEVENVIGQIKVRETELKLQKAPGEF